MLFIFANIGTLPALAAPPQDITELDVWRQMDPRILHRLASVVASTPSGAIGNNRATFTQVGLQNQSSWIVPEALVTQNAAELARAFDIITFGFNHELADGSFEWHAGASGTADTELSRAGSAAFFLADVAQSFALLAQSDWFRSSPDAAPLRARESRLLPRTRLALNWLLGERQTLSTDTAAVNRSFIYAMALSGSGAVLGNPAAGSAGLSFVQSALDRQSDDGVFPESGGFDSSYQGVSLYLAQIAWLGPMRGTPIRSRLWASIARAANREMQVVALNGSVSTANNTRVGAAGEKLFGVRKSVDGRAITLGLLFYGRIAGDGGATARGTATARVYHVDGT